MFSPTFGFDLQILIRTNGITSGGWYSMPGTARRYTDKEEREAQHIIESEMARGLSREDAERIAYATINKHRDEAGLDEA